MNSMNYLTLKFNNRLSLRLYRDASPHCLEIAPLHKGLVLVLDDVELIEEGAGFGTPVVIYNDSAYFSISAKDVKQVPGKHQALVKTYVMNAVSRKKIGNSFYLNERFYSLVHAIFHRAYVSHKNQAHLFNKIMELRKLLGMKTHFLEAKPRGVITVKYICFDDRIDVEVTLSELDKSGCREILVLNEQGATFFNKYRDASGLTLLDHAIGAWEDVRGDEACLSDENDTISFTVESKDGVRLFRGREKIHGRFSWAGLGYSLHPELSVFKYSIRLSESQNAEHTRLSGINNQDWCSLRIE